jgi:sterol desaturase/sphingolipid hydroxylase (fatty acid hydroxylase superfamily)/Flp pilus assembly protein TadG
VDADFLTHLEAMAAQILALLADPFVQFLFWGSLFWWPYLLTTLAIALIGFFYAHRDASLGEFRRRFFSRRIWAHPSAQADYAYYLVNSVLHPVIVAPLIFSGAAVGLWIESGLVHFFGPTRSALLGITPARILYTVLFFLAYDFARFAAHGLLHDVPILWQFHKVHHSAEVLTPITNYRAHPVELFLMAAIPNLATGIVTGVAWYIAAGAVTVYTFLGAHIFIVGFNSFANLRHSHVWISFGPRLNRWLVSPAHHQLHHSCDPRHFGKNRGFELAIWDRLCGTLCVPGAAEPLRLGLCDGSDAAWHGVGRMYLWPFRHALALAGIGRSPVLAALTYVMHGLWHDRGGNYSMIVVLLLPVLTGFVGVGTEMGLWLYDQQAEQTAADAAAFSAAVYYKTQSPVAGGNTTAGPAGQTQALAVAANYGFRGSPACATESGVTSCTQPANCNVSAPATGGTCGQVNNPPAAGAQSGNAAAFEIIIAQSPQQLFSKVLISNPVVIKARSVGVVTGKTQNSGACTGTGCVCVKVTNTNSATTKTASFSGTANLTLNGCSLEVDDPNAAAFNLTGTAKVSASNFYLANSMDDYAVNGTTCSPSNQSATGCNAVTGTLASLPSGGYADPYQTQLQSAINGSGCPVSPPTPPVSSSPFGPMANANGTPGTAYYSQIRITANTVLRPGTYYVCSGGTVQISGTSVVQSAPFPLPSGCTSPYSCPADPVSSSDGVTIVLLNGASGCPAFVLSGTASLLLVPPQSGPFAGIVLTSSTNCTPPAAGTLSGAGTAQISGGASTQVFGAVDLANYSITYAGTASAGTGGCLNIIANSFTVTGTASLSSNCTGVGTTGIGPQGGTTVYTAALSN